MQELRIKDTNNVWHLLDTQEDIAVNFQYYDIESGNAAASYSQSIKLPLSVGNCKAFNFPNIFDSSRDVKYQLYECRLSIDGVVICGKGYNLKIISVDGNINAQIIGGNALFYEAIKRANSSGEQVTLHDLTFNQSYIPKSIDGFEHAKSLSNYPFFFALCDFLPASFQVEGSWTDSGIYIWDSTDHPAWIGMPYIFPKYQCPFIYLHDIAAKIITDAGYAYSFLINFPVFAFSLKTNGNNNKMDLPDQTQEEFFKFFLQLTGLFTVVDEISKTVSFHSIDEIIYNKTAPVQDSDPEELIAKNWSKKYNDGSGQTQYAVGSFAQKNKVTFNISPSSFYGIRNQDTDTKYLYINNNALDLIKDLLTIPYATLFDFGWGSGSNAFTTVRIEKFERVTPADPGPGIEWNTFTEIEGQEIYLVRMGERKNVLVNTGTASNGHSTFDIYNLPCAQFTDVNRYDESSATGIIENNYGSMRDIILDQPRKIIDAEFYLTPQDIADFDQSIPIYIDKFGAYFYICKIKNFVSGKLTKCDLIKI